MSNLALFIWGGTLGIVVLVIVPLALSLLSRALRNARSIEHYLSDMLDAGVKIAGHTEAVSALNNTLSAAGKMGEIAPVIEKKTRLVAKILAKRAEGDAS